MGLALPAILSAGGSFDAGYGIWSPSGLWHRVVAPACATPSSGVACVYYGLDASCDYATGQAQDASLTTLEPVPLTASTAFISFWLLYQVQSYDPACQDRLRLEYSPDGTNWYVADDDLTTQNDPEGGSPSVGWSSGGGLGGTPLWQYENIPLASFAGTSYYWRFRYLSSEQMAGNAVCSPPDLLQQFLGFALDDISLGQAPVALSLAKSVSPVLAAPGATFTFSLSVTNTGSTESAVQIWDSLPEGVGYASAPGGSISGGLAQWSVPSLGPGQSATVRLLAQAPATLDPPMDWIDAGEASSSLATSPVLSAQVLAKIRAQGLSLAKSVSPSVLTSGEMATYSLVVENNTGLTQAGLSLSDALPAAFSPEQVYPQESGATYWSLPSLAPGQVFSCSLWGPVYGQNGQIVVNTATLSQGASILAEASASLSVQKPVQPAISIQAVYPNPAPSHQAGSPQDAFVAYTRSTSMVVNLDIYDVAGERVRSLSAPGAQGAGTLEWDLRNSRGLPVASGLYILRLWSPVQVQPQPQAVGYLAVSR
ncbi:MAG: hypothetical protein ACREKE_00255 [bacterium]